MELSFGYTRNIYDIIESFFFYFIVISWSFEGLIVFERIVSGQRYAVRSFILNILMYRLCWVVFEWLRMIRESDRNLDIVLRRNLKLLKNETRIASRSSEKENFR